MIQPLVVQKLCIYHGCTYIHKKFKLNTITYKKQPRLSLFFLNLYKRIQQIPIVEMMHTVNML